MGQEQHTSSPISSPSRRRFPVRTCHRRHCGRVFSPRQWNQRYCREPDCLRELHRWEAAKRQRQRRKNEKVRRQHADAERQRRSRKREERRAREASGTQDESVPQAQIDGSESRAWSRSDKIPENFCDRPGCYDPVSPSCRVAARYCGDECRQAVRRVLDRERKFKDRQKKRAARRRGDTLGSHRRDRRQSSCRAVENRDVGVAHSRRKCVRNYGGSPAGTLSSGETHRETLEHDRETDTGRRPRAPPSA